MDVVFFLKERTHFIRTFYDAAAAPFLETLRRIEAEEPPFEPPYSEDSEPAFQTEYMEATTALGVLGRTGVSLLSDSLKLFFLTWEKLLLLKCQPMVAKTFKKRGFLYGYIEAFQAQYGIDVAQSRVNLDLLEQIILARNDSQHPGEITTMSIAHGSSAAKGKGRTTDLFFLSDSERAVIDNGGASSSFPPLLQIDHAALFESIDAVENFADWLEEKLMDERFPARKAHP